jgi:CspA family cold shock protein
MPVGTVKWYDRRRGYGFILSPEGVDVFAHFTVIEGTGYRMLFCGEHVEYEFRRTPKGLQATFIRHLKADGHSFSRPPIPPTAPPNPKPQ